MVELFRRKRSDGGFFRGRGRVPGVLLIAGLVLLANQGRGDADNPVKRFFLTPTLQLPVDTVVTYLVTVEDSIPNDTLFQLRSVEGFPVAYYRKINTDVCFDGECRMLKVSLYWNITGRYLGLELPPGEFLSKSDHEPFNQSEYDRMNRLLADSLSPLADYSFEQLVPSSGDLFPGSGNNIIGNLAADAVTSATSPAMIDYVVRGAAYTTYRLWHFVYGPTQDMIVRLTTASLDRGLLERVLDSPDRSDIAWALQRLQVSAPVGAELRQAVVGLIQDEDYSLASMAIATFSPADLASADLQHALIEKLPGLNYSLANQILEKLKEAPELDAEVQMTLARDLKSAEGSFLSHVLDLLLEQQATDTAICRLLSDMLQDENDFVARQVFAFLKKAGSADETVRERMQRYQQSRH